MKIGSALRVLIAILTLGGFLYAYINKQNEITQLRLQIPRATQEVADITQENTRLKFEIDQFESPSHLLELSRQPEYRHLKHPLLKEITQVKVEKD
jgi:hypothetical protein